MMPMVVPQKLAQLSVALEGLLCRTPHQTTAPLFQEIQVTLPAGRLTFMVSCSVFFARLPAH
jgi:hypothetical protein